MKKTQKISKYEQRKYCSDILYWYIKKIVICRNNDRAKEIKNAAFLKHNADENH